MCYYSFSWNGGEPRDNKWYENTEGEKMKYASVSGGGCGTFHNEYFSKTLKFM